MPASRPSGEGQAGAGGEPKPGFGTALGHFFADLNDKIHSEIVIGSIAIIAVFINALIIAQELM